jgi:hypothetical protein
MTRVGRRRLVRFGRRLAALGAAAALTVALAQSTTTAAFTAQTGNGNTVSTATTFCTSPGSDTAVAGEDSSTNGTPGNTTNTNAGGNLSVGTSTAGDGYGYIRFTDMDPVPSRCRILSATLTLYATTSQAAAMQVQRAASSWSQTSLNWSNQPAAAGTPFLFTVPGGAGQQVLTVTQLVQDIYNGSNYGFLVRDQASLIATRYQIYSSFENGTVANRPKLSFSWG